MERHDLVQRIESLYPADADYPKTAEAGQELLLEAIFKAWRWLPAEVLAEYARLCERKEQRDEAGFRKQFNERMV